MDYINRVALKILRKKARTWCENQLKKCEKMKQNVYYFSNGWVKFDQCS